MYVYKIFETVNNFYYYVISHIDDTDIVLEHKEHYCALRPEVLINKYLNFIGWDAVDCEKSDIRPIDLINNNIPQDEKCMNNSQKFSEFIIEKPKAKRAPKNKAVQIDKPKTKGKKAQLIIQE